MVQNHVWRHGLNRFENHKMESICRTLRQKKEDMAGMRLTRIPANCMIVTVQRQGFWRCGLNSYVS